MLLVLIFYYNISIKILIPDFFEIKKFKIKNSVLPFFYTFKYNRTAKNFPILTNLFFIKSKIGYMNSKKFIICLIGLATIEITGCIFKEEIQLTITENFY